MKPNVEVLTSTHSSQTQEHANDNHDTQHDRYSSYDDGYLGSGPASRILSSYHTLDNHERDSADQTSD